MLRNSISDRRIALAALLAAVFVPALAFGQDAGTRLGAIAPDIVLVRTTGAWNDGTRGGTTRIVILRAAGRDEAYRLFVQWLVVDQRSGRVAVASSEEVREVFDWRLKIDDYRVEPDAEGARVVFEATVLAGNLARGYILTIGLPGEITFGPR